MAHEMDKKSSDNAGIIVAASTALVEPVSPAVAIDVMHADDSVQPNGENKRVRVRVNVSHQAPPKRRRRSLGTEEDINTLLAKRQTEHVNLMWQIKLLKI
jgi:hypothetical protein